MSDSFADLWNTSAPLPAKPKPQTLTLAARLAEERTRQRHRVNTVDLQSHNTPDVSHATWAGLDSLDSGIKVKVDEDDDRDILHTNSQALKSSALLHLLDNDNDHDNLLGGTGNHEDEEDILGMLSKPVEVVIAKKVFLFLLTLHCFISEIDLNFIPFFRTRIQERRRLSHVLHHYLDKVQDPPPLHLTS
jgi:hypothetical protein